MSDKGPSKSTEQTQKQITQEQINLAQKQDARSDQLFKLTLPGLKDAESHYEQLASGDPNAIFKAVAPSAQAIKQQTNVAKQNIKESSPRGGAQDLALQEADISGAGAVGNIVNQSYEGAFPALASLSGHGIGLSINEMSNAIAAFGGASNTASNLANEQEAGKASMLGMFGALGGGAMELAAAA